MSLELPLTRPLDSPASVSNRMKRLPVGPPNIETRTRSPRAITETSRPASGHGCSIVHGPPTSLSILTGLDTIPLS